MSEYDVRKSVLAGTWYPDDPEVLQKDITSFLQQAPVEPIKGRVIGLIAPHAGYAHSGDVAAHAYRLIRGQKYDAVIVVGPSHRVPFQGVSIVNRGGFETPLGVVAVDQLLADRIMAESSLVSATPEAHRYEHSIEIQLPFLQVTLGAFSFVPLMMGSQDRSTCEELAAAIVSAVSGRKVLVVGSTDLSHFHGYDQAVQMDARALSTLETMDAEGFLADFEGRTFEACGGGPAAVAMMVAKKLGARKSRLLKYANSGDVTGERHSVVGYAAAVYYQEEDSPEKPEEEESNDRGYEPRTTSHELFPGKPEQKEPNRAGGAGAGAGLTEEDKQLLLNLVRSTIESRLEGRTVPEPAELTEIVREERGAFVTLKKRGCLRGCIGYIEARKPLYDTVKEMALAAAFHDPRFPILKKDELDDLTVEISVLSPLKEISDIAEIEVGRHGLYILRGGCGGLLLPQVATECHWDKMTFLRETCRKAGLNSNAWQDQKTKIFIFSADVFGTHE